MPPPGDGRVSAIVVAGGASRRMGGVDKVALTAGGTTLLDRVLEAARPLCHRLVAVGPSRPTAVAGVRFVRERSPGGGPAPAVLAGLDLLDTETTALVLAADLPLLTTVGLAALLAALDSDPDHLAAAAGNRGGAANPLLAAYRCTALRTAADLGVGPGTPAVRLLPEATVVVDLGRTSTLNVNRPADLERAASLLSSGRALTKPRPSPGERADIDRISI